MTPARLWFAATLMLAAWVYAVRIGHAQDDLIGELAEGAAPADDGASDGAGSTGKPDAWAALGQDVRVRKVVVAGFDGKGALRLRQAVLDALSEHTEVEVIGAKDVEISAKSLGHSIHDRKGRAALSKELGIYAWVDHEVDSGSIRLVDAEGKTLAALGVGEHRGSEADLRATIWSTLGPHVSDQGLRMHLLEQLRASASSKLKAGEQEAERQLEIALRRAERRANHLAASKQRAAAVLAAQQAERSRQQELAVARIEREQAEQARQAELARQAALAHQQQLAQQAEQARQAELAQQLELQRQAELARQRQLQQQQQQAAIAKQAAPPQPAYAPPQPAYAAEPANEGGAWQPSRPQPVFAQPQPAQPAYAPQPQPAYAEPAYAPQPQPAYAPQPQPAYAEPPPSAAMPVSPATQAWLERRRAQQQAGAH